MIYRNIRIFWKYFVILFLLSFLFVNWADFGWVFNYRVVSETIAQVAETSSSPVEDLKEELPAETDQKIVMKEEEITVEKEEIREDNTIEIAKIGILAPIIFFENAEEKNEVLHASLDKGTVHFPSSVLPGEIGQTIILGHSAPPGWPEIKYDWVFSELGSLVWGDEISIYFGGQEYLYHVKDKIFLDRGGELPEEDHSVSKNTLILLSCWPPGKNYMRIAVIAEPFDKNTN